MPDIPALRNIWVVFLRCVVSNTVMILLVDKTIVPKTANDVKLISGGKILENDKNIAQCRAPFGDLPSTVMTMHVVVQPSSAKSKPGEL